MLTKWQEAGSLLGGILAAHFTCLLDFMPLCLLVGLKFGLHGVLTDCSISDKKSAQRVRNGPEWTSGPQLRINVIKSITVLH